MNLHFVLDSRVSIDGRTIATPTAMAMCSTCPHALLCLRKLRYPCWRFFSRLIQSGSVCDLHCQG